MNVVNNCYRTSDSSGTLTEVDGIGCLRDTRPHPDYDGDFDDFKMPAFNVGNMFILRYFQSNLKSCPN